MGVMVGVLQEGQDIIVAIAKLSERSAPKAKRVPLAARRSKSAPHMHVLVCICSNVR